MAPFRRFVALTLFMTYVVILAGAVVRGTGSGLGCPDWPRCFGHWIPPVDISELPADYKEQFKIDGKVIADFEAFKTWTEYLNRLLGALLGLMIVRLFIKSFKYTDKEPNLPWFCGGLLLLVSLQGGVGALVVFSHLKPYIITLHMFLALVLLFSLQYLQKYCSDLDHFGINFKPDTHNLFVTKILILVGIIQVGLGTQVRESVDHLIRDTAEATKSTVVNQLSWDFYVHRSFSIIFLSLTIWALVRLYKQDITGSGFKRAIVLLVLLLLNLASGVGLNYFGFPAQLQPPHLFVGVLSMGVLFQQYLDQKGTLIS
ncbi:MAG: COX15/CtaA family protein [Bacteriovoracaceae bacterium]|nr:COX15/CtaA family protein [Bacteriovoracaceae bacterium]